ncbi:MAG: hypothetical protein AB7N71_14170, partial [Phycisphaerae bacterium]
MSKDRDILSDWIASGCHCIAIQTFEEDYAIAVASELADRFQRTLYIWSADVGFRAYEGLAEDDTTEPLAAFKFVRALPAQPQVLYL